MPMAVPVPVPRRSGGGGPGGGGCAAVGGRRAEAKVVLRPPAVVGEDVVGVRGLAEAPRSVGTGAGVDGLGVAVGVVAEGAAAESGLDLGLGGVGLQPERPVVVAHGERRVSGRMDRKGNTGGRKMGTTTTAAWPLFSPRVLPGIFFPKVALAELMTL